MHCAQGLSWGTRQRIDAPWLRSIQTRSNIAASIRRGWRGLCASAHPPALVAPILQTSKDELGETTMTTAKLIAANFAAWSLAIGIWALNLGVFEAVA